MDQGSLLGRFICQFVPAEIPWPARLRHPHVLNGPSLWRETTKGTTRRNYCAKHMMNWSSSQ
eukprot:9501377-Pyramimonas_sp.AAC.1